MTYRTNWGAVLGAGTKYCRACGRPALTASEGSAETPDEGTGAAQRTWPFKPDRLDKAVALVVGVALLIPVLWFLVQFFLGFLAGLFGGLKFCKVGRVGRLLDGVEASILHLSLVGFALPLCLSHSYDLACGAPTSGVIPSNNPARRRFIRPV